MVKKPSFITWHEILFLALIFIFGILSYLKVWILFLNGLNPLWGFLVYYLIWFVILFVLSLTKFVILGHRIKNPFQIIGTMMIIFSINVLVNWTNGYVGTIVGAGSGASIFYGSEDGVLWYLVHDLIGIQSLWLAKFIAFSVLNTLIALGGMLLVRKVKFDMFTD